MSAGRNGLLTGLLAGGCLLLLQAQGAYLTDGVEDSAGREVVVEERVRPPIVPRPPEDGDSLRRLLRQVETGRPVAYGRVSVVPLEIRDGGESAGIRTLDEALRNGWITIREQAEARVSSVVVRNESRRTVFLMAGEMLGGGRQDRILQKDVLLTPEMGDVVVPVYCGEKERWAGPQDSFALAPSSVAGNALRSMAAREASQDAIWGEIDAKLEKSGVKAPTRSYQSLYSDPEIGRQVADRVERFRKGAGRRTVGLVIVELGRVVSVDLFGDPVLCAALWDKVLRAYVVDHPREEEWRMDRRVSEDGAVVAARRCLADLGRAEQTRVAGAGAGGHFVLGGRMNGRMLEWNREVVHVAAFPEDVVRPMRSGAGLYEEGE